MTTTMRPAAAVTGRPETDEKAAELAKQRAAQARLDNIEAGLLAAEHHLVELVDRIIELSANRAELRHLLKKTVRDLAAENALSALLAGRFGANGAHLAIVVLRMAHEAEPPTVVRDLPTEPPSSLE